MSIDVLNPIVYFGGRDFCFLDSEPLQPLELA